MLEVQELKCVGFQLKWPPCMASLCFEIDYVKNNKTHILFMSLTHLLRSAKSGKELPQIKSNSYCTFV